MLICKPIPAILGSVLRHKSGSFGELQRPERNVRKKGLFMHNFKNQVALLLVCTDRDLKGMIKLRVHRVFEHYVTAERVVCAGHAHKHTSCAQ